VFSLLASIGKDSKIEDIKSFLEEGKEDK